MLNAQDISVEKIKSGIGGYKKKATKEFIDAVRLDYEALYKENLELKDKLGILSDGVQYYKNMEKSLQKALVLAEKTTAETVHAAEVKAFAMEKEAQAKANSLTKEAKIRADAYEKEATIKAESILKDAKAKADLAVLEGNEELRRIHSKIMTLVQQFEQYKSQYKQLAMAQMNVLESEAYNLDAPILKTVSESLEKMNDTEQGDISKKQNIENKDVDEQEVVKPIRGSNDENDGLQEKKMYVDGRGEVVEVHEFREITLPGNKSNNWEESKLDDLNDDFLSWEKSMKPVSFGNNEDSSTLKKEYPSFEEERPISTSYEKHTTLEKGYPSFKEERSFSTSYEEDTTLEKGYPSFEERPILSSYEEDATLEKGYPSFEEEKSFSTSYEQNSTLEKDYQSFEYEKSNAFFDTGDIVEKDNSLVADTNKALDFDNMTVSNNNESFLGSKQQDDIKMHTDETIYTPNKNDGMSESHHLSQSDMKRIAQQQMEQVRLEQEKQAEYLRTGRYHKDSEEKKEQDNCDVQKNTVKDNVDFFSVIHKQDEESVMTLRDIQLQREKENEQVVLPKATEGANFNSPIEDKRMEDSMLENSGNDLNGSIHSRDEEKNFFQQFSDETEHKSQFSSTEDFSESKNSLEYEMDHNQSFANSITEKQKFKSLREFESEL